MKQLNRWFWISLVSLCLLLFASRSLAHNDFPTINNSHLDGKVANLEIGLRQLQREMGQLRLQPPSPRQSPTPPTPVPQRSTSTSDPQLQNLANLVIELKQDIQSLETRLSQLEP